MSTKEERLLVRWRMRHASADASSSLKDFFSSLYETWKKKVDTCLEVYRLEKTGEPLPPALKRFNTDEVEDNLTDDFDSFWDEEESVIERIRSKVEPRTKEELKAYLTSEEFWKHENSKELVEGIVEETFSDVYRDTAKKIWKETFKRKFQDLRKQFDSA